MTMRGVDCLNLQTVAVRNAFLPLAPIATLTAHRILTVALRSGCIGLHLNVNFGETCVCSMIVGRRLLD
jgi:hypothetical protein